MYLNSLSKSNYNLLVKYGRITLRKLKTDDNLLLLKTNLSAGHGGGSGRYDGYKDLAYKYAVIFDVFAKEILQEIADKEAAEKAEEKVKDGQ